MLVVNGGPHRARCEGTIRLRKQAATPGRLSLSSLTRQNGSGRAAVVWIEGGSILFDDSRGNIRSRSSATMDSHLYLSGINLVWAHILFFELQAEARP